MYVIYLPIENNSNIHLLEKLQNRKSSFLFLEFCYIFVMNS